MRTGLQYGVVRWKKYIRMKWIIINLRMSVIIWRTKWKRSVNGKTMTIKWRDTRGEESCGIFLIITNNMNCKQPGSIVQVSDWAYRS